MDILNEFIFNFPSITSYFESHGIVIIEISCGGSDIPSNLHELIDSFPKRDLVKIELDNGDLTSFDNNGSFSSNVEFESIEAYLDNIDPTDEFKIIVTIEKGIDDYKFSIYNFESFLSNLSSKSSLEILSIFSEILKDKTHLIFELYDSDFFIYTRSLIFKAADASEITPTESNRLEKIKSCKENSNFKNSNIDLIPDDFHFLANYGNNPFCSMFQKFKCMLSLVYISNSSSIDNNEFSVQIFDQRLHEDKYQLDKDAIENDELFKIYDWVYTDGNPTDKVIIARNVMSLHCKYSKIKDIDAKTFDSIKSNFSIYQRKDVEKYIDLKNKLTDYIIEESNKVSNTVLDLFGRLKNNVFIFLTYFLTLFLTNSIFDPSSETVFTQDAIFLTQIALLISFAYLIVSWVEVKYKVSEIERGYESLKKNYDNLLDSEDKKQIFSNDNKFKKSKWRLY